MRAIAAALVVMSAAAPARAQDDSDDFPGGKYFYDAGAIGLIYAPLAVVAVVELGLDPPESPRLFPPDEGGVSEFGNTIPEIYVGVGGAMVAAGMFLRQREGRWFHIKGMAQSVAVTLALTSVGKNVFGRHRPHWSPDTTVDADTRRSFPSGHSSTSFSIATYGCLFLHRDGPGVVSGVSCAALVASAGFTAYSRVRDSRHHGSDVLAGAVLGTLTSASMFVLAESRYQLELELDIAAGPSSVVVGLGGQL